MNGPLQGRVNILNLDLIRTKEALDNCDIDPECDWNDLSIQFIFINFIKYTIE
jgi:hypothetical protein